MITESVILKDDVWFLILREVNVPEVSSACKLFKEIHSQEDTIHYLVMNELKERGLVHLLDSKLPVRQQLINAKTSLLLRLITFREESTKLQVKKQEILSGPGFMKLLREESAINLIHVYNKIPLVKPDLTGSKLETQVDRICAFLNVTLNQIAQVEALDLSDSCLTAIPKELECFTGLKTIQLNGNKIDFLSSSCGRSWEKLEECYLGNNKVNTLPEGFGDNWPFLKNFFIESSALTFLPTHFGSSWKNLKILNISTNNIKELPSDFGSNWKAIETLDMGWNNLQSLPKGFGRAWEKIHFLILIGNNFSVEKMNEIRKELKSLANLY